MRRRDLMPFVFGGAISWSCGSFAQQSSRIWRLGFLAHGYETFYDPLFSGLRELGYEQGRNLVVEARYSEGHSQRFAELAADLVRLEVDLIIVVTTPAALAVKKATTTIPVVFPNAINPVETGVVASLGHPGGNVTGGAIPTAELSAKRLELSKRSCPGCCESQSFGIRLIHPSR